MDRLSLCVGAEVKSGESRVTLTPSAAQRLRAAGFDVAVQSSAQRCFTDDQYRELGVPVVDSTAGFQVVVATKEPSPAASGKANQMRDDQISLRFWHAHKGQPHNRPILREAIARRISMFDYELYRLGDGSQPITTSRYAGIAGAVNGLSTFGRRREAAGQSSALAKLPPPGQYRSVEVLRCQIEALGTLTEDLRVVVVGTGGCGAGAQEVCQWLKLPELRPEVVLNGTPTGPWHCVLKTEDTVRKYCGSAYDKQDYREHGANAYRSTFSEYLGRHNLLVFCPYWDERFPKLLPRSLMQSRKHELPVVSDVTCDIDGSLECTRREATIVEPIFSYDVDRHEVAPGIDPAHLTVTAVDNLPAQIGESCSEHLANSLEQVLPALLSVDQRKSLEESGLPIEMQRAFITWRGELTPAYAHLASLI